MTPSRPPELPAGCRLIEHATLDSTNTEARRLATTDRNTNRVFIWAHEQNAGRGRRGNHWVSPPGNMYLSVILRPACDVTVATQLGFVAAIALADAVICATGISPRLKWPNDLLVDDAKLSGILVESAAKESGAIDWLVVGTGLNIASHPTTLAGTTCLRDLGSSVDVEEMVTAYADCLMTRYDEWASSGFAPIRNAWLERAIGVGRPVRVRLTDHEETGIFEDLDETGALVLVQGDRRRKITSGEVFPVIAT